MGKITAIVQGSLARKKGVECTTLGGVPFVCDLRVLDGDEENICLGAACKAAREGGGEPVETDLMWQFANAANIVALAATDPDSPPDAPVAFFDNVKQVLKYLDRDRILLLSTAQRLFQEQVSPVRHTLNDEEFTALVLATAASEEGEDLPLEKLPRYTRNHCIRTMAVLLSSSQTPKSSISSGEKARD